MVCYTLSCVLWYELADISDAQRECQVLCCPELGTRHVGCTDEDNLAACGLHM